MAPNLELIDMLNRLGPAEIRAIKGMLRGHELKLFDLLRKHKSYDPAKLTKTLNISAQHLSQLKLDLFNSVVMHAARIRDANGNGLDPSQMHREASFLIDNELYAEAEKRILLGIEAARAKDDFKKLSELLSLKRDLLLAVYPGQRLDELDAIMTEDIEALEKVLDLYRKNHFYTRAFQTRRSEPDLNSLSARALLDSVMKEPGSLSQTALLWEVRSKLLLAVYATQDERRTIAAGVASMLREIPKGINQAAFAVEYTRAVFVVGLRAAAGRNFEELEAQARTLEDFSHEMGHHAIVAYAARVRRWNLLIHKARIQCDERAGLALIREVKDALSGGLDLEINPPMRNYFLYSFAQTAFHFGLYSEANGFVQLLVDGPNPTLSHAFLYHFAHILRVVIHIELANTELVESLVMKAKRKLGKEGAYGEYERSFLDYLQRAPGLLPTEFEALTREAKSKLEGIILKPENMKRKFQFEILEYLDSKLTGRPFLELLREKYASPEKP